MNLIFKNIYDQLCNLGRWYGAGFAFCALGTLISLFYNPSAVMPAFGLIASICFAVGFLVAFFPYAKKIWKAPLGRYLTVLVHGLALLLAIIPGRFLTTAATQLPSQYFDFTVAVCTWIYYPAVLILILAILLLGLILCLAVAEVLLKFTTLPLISQLIETTGTSISINAFRKFSLDSYRKSLASKFMNHMFGGAIVFGMALFAVSAYFLAMDNLTPAVRWMAYLADFQSSPIYPGIQKDARFRLMDNGVVAYASIKDHAVLITVGDYSQK